MDSRLATRMWPRKPFLRCPRTLLSDPSARIHRVCPHIFGRRAKSRMGPVFASTCKAWVRWAVREESRVKISRATVDLHDLATVKEAEPAHRQAGIWAKSFCRLCSAKPSISFCGPSVCLCQASSREMSITLVNVPGPTNWYQKTSGVPSLWNASCGRITPCPLHPHADMIFVKKFTPPDFQAKNFTTLISQNFNSFVDKSTNKWVKMEKFTLMA